MRQTPLTTQDTVQTDSAVGRTEWGRLLWVSKIPCSQTPRWTGHSGVRLLWVSKISCSQTPQWTGQGEVGLFLEQKIFTLPQLLLYTIVLNCPVAEKQNNNKHKNKEKNVKTNVRDTKPLLFFLPRYKSRDFLSLPTAKYFTNSCAFVCRCVLYKTRRDITAATATKRVQND